MACVAFALVAVEHITVSPYMVQFVAYTCLLELLFDFN